MRQRLSNWCHRLGHVIDPAAQPLCLCRSQSFLDLIAMRRRTEYVARNPDELRALIAASEQEGGVIHTGDCIEVMAGMPADSVDAVVTDPPYGLEFMGKAWDSFRASNAGVQKSGWSKLGQHGTPTFSPNRRNQKCPDCGKWAYDHQGRKCECGGWKWSAQQQYSLAFQAWCEAWGREALRVTKPGGYLLAFGGTRTHHRLVCGLEDAGWLVRDELTWVYASGFPKGRANLKPAHEPIVLARKPGPLRALNIDECRIPGAVPQTVHGVSSRQGEVYGHFRDEPEPSIVNEGGRWPSNLLLSDPELFDVANPGVVGSGASASTGGLPTDERGTGGIWHEGNGVPAGPQYGDSGGYSRFFLIPKSSRSDREPVIIPDGHDRTKRFSTHPTQKPTDLMRHLIRLVTPPGGLVLDPFLGSGTTGIAAELEGFPWLGIEQDAGYVAIAEARLNGVQRGLGLAI